MQTQARGRVRGEQCPHREEERSGPIGLSCEEGYVHTLADHSRLVQGHGRASTRHSRVGRAGSLCSQGLGHWSSERRGETRREGCASRDQC